MIATVNIAEDVKRPVKDLIDLKALVEKAYELTPMPVSAIRLASLVASHQYDVKDVSEVIAYDPALTLRLIRSANSAVQGSSTPVTTAKDAVVRLGSAQILALAIASTARPLMKQAVPEYQLDEGQLWRHSITTAIITELLPQFCKSPIPPEAFTAALLHDIGKLVMARFLEPDVLRWIKRAQSEGGLNALEAERDILSVHHGELGGIVAQHWKMPDSIVKGIIYHHTPEETDDIVCSAVYLANIAAKNVEAKLDGVKYEMELSEETFEELDMNQSQLEELCLTAVSRYAELTARFKSR